MPYSNRTVELVSVLEDAEQKISKVEMKRAFVRGIPMSFDTTEEFTMSTGLSHEEALAEQIVMETRLGEL